MARVRDTQRGKVYKAEAHLPEALWGRKFKTLPECQTYYEHIVGSRWWKGRAAVIPVMLRDGRGTSVARAFAVTGIAFINLPRWSRQELWMLHELAHVLYRHGYEYQNTRDTRPHGAAFVRLFLDLVRRWMGPETAKALRESMLEHGVRIVNRKR